MSRILRATSMPALTVSRQPDEAWAAERQSEVERGKLTRFQHVGFCCGIFVGVASSGLEGTLHSAVVTNPENISQPCPARSRISRMVGIRFTFPSPALQPEFIDRPPPFFLTPWRIRGLKSLHSQGRRERLLRAGEPRLSLIQILRS